MAKVLLPTHKFPKTAMLREIRYLKSDEWQIKLTVDFKPTGKNLYLILSDDEFQLIREAKKEG